MAARAAKRRARTTARPRRPSSPEERAAYAEIKQGVRHLESSIGEIQRGLRKAEKDIEAQARARIRELRKDARAQLGVLKGKRREVTRTLGRLSAAAEGSWEEVKRSADAMLSDARATAASVIERLRAAIAR